MKNYFKILPLLLLLFCAAKKSNSQNNFNTSPEKYLSKKQSLPQNRTTFIFCNSTTNSTYSNPAYAMLNTKKDNSVFKNIQASSVASFNEIKTIITQDDFCMFSNTTEDELWVQLNNIQLAEKSLNIEIYNSDGERVYISSLQNQLHKINVCDFSTGTFLLKLGDNVQKMVIE